MSLIEGATLAPKPKPKKKKKKMLPCVLMTSYRLPDPKNLEFIANSFGLDPANKQLFHEKYDNVSMNAAGVWQILSRDFSWINPKIRDSILLEMFRESDTALIEAKKLLTNVQKK